MRNLWIISLLLFCASGCGSPYKIAPVSGRVTIDGKPGANCHVAFDPIGSQQNPTPGPQAVGITNEEGVFSLQTVPDKYKGAVVGKCRVRILNLGGLGPQLDEDTMLKLYIQKRAGGIPKPLPARYNLKTELTFDVPPQGTDSANFDLKSW